MKNLAIRKVFAFSDSVVSGFENADFPFCHPSNSVIQAHHLPHHGGSGEGGKPFSKSIVCKKGEGDADGQVL